ncbi:MAG: GxxExxY protein [Planctomycetota bacterium]|nr:MAG: GxxExxY protein [Planctomycetota bacterium]
MELNEISGAIVNCSMRVHTVLGPGLLESAYQKCLAHELRKRGYSVGSEVPMPVIYDGVEIELGYRIDLLVSNEVVIEVKALSEITPVHKAQLLSYLRLSKKKLGLLLNFHVDHMKDGIYRIVNNL